MYGHWNMLWQMSNHDMAFKLLDCGFIGGASAPGIIASCLSAC